MVRRAPSFFLTAAIAGIVMDGRRFLYEVVKLYANGAD
jgi:hypothetical protein